MKTPSGYRYASTYAGIRQAPKDDLALIVSDTVAAAAGMFTTNRVQAAPVRLGRKHLARSGGYAQAILVNAGNANCATRNGDRVALLCCRAVAQALRIPVHHVLPASTGVIGVEMDHRPIVAQIPHLVTSLSAERLPDVAKAIMTTDTRPKIAATEFCVGRGTVRIAGVTKGAGMIHPKMATTLAFVMTDAALTPVELYAALVPAVEASYHRLTIDGDTSTNDTVYLLANGSSGVRVTGRLRKTFTQALTEVLEDLACQIARDGEGARKLIVIDVEGTRTDGEAAQLARAIANSPLVKTAIAGADPNWGRVLAAAGYAGVPFDPARADIWIQGVRVCAGGVGARFSESELAAKLEQNEVHIRLRIRGKGRGRTRFWTCDLTENYIRINADYRT